MLLSVLPLKALQMHRLYLSPRHFSIEVQTPPSTACCWELENPGWLTYSCKWTFPANQFLPGCNSFKWSQLYVHIYILHIWFLLPASPGQLMMLAFVKLHPISCWLRTSQVSSALLAALQCYMRWDCTCCATARIARSTFLRRRLVCRIHPFVHRWRWRNSVNSCLCLNRRQGLFGRSLRLAVSRWNYKKNNSLKALLEALYHYLARLPLSMIALAIVVATLLTCAWDVYQFLWSLRQSPVLGQRCCHVHIEPIETLQEFKNP